MFLPSFSRLENCRPFRRNLLAHHWQLSGVVSVLDVLFPSGLILVVAQVIIIKSDHQEMEVCQSMEGCPDRRVSEGERMALVQCEHL